ncbi:MAG: LysR family transcriptional regulator [Solobacterium sp.]|nr:LysR family transcriptional regulator [Solobacterium sp.]
MNIEDLEKINTVIESGSINKAAEKLFVSQPALSRIIRKAEEEYEIILFDRTQGKKIVLTEDGERFYKMSKEILLLHDNFLLQTKLNQSRNENTILFGTATQQAILYMSEMLSWFYANEPKYRLETKGGKSNELHMDVINRKLDVAFLNVTRFSNELHYEKIERMRTFFYLSSNSPLLEKIKDNDSGEVLKVHIQDLKDEHFVVNKKGTASRDIFDQLCSRYNLNPVYVEEENMYQRMKLADNGVGSYILTAGRVDRIAFAKGGMSHYVVLDDQEDIESWRYLICRKGFENTEQYKVIQRCLKDLGNAYL